MQRLCALTYLLEVFRQHPPYWYLHASPLRIAVQRQRCFQRGQRELVGPHGAGERIGAAGFDRGLGAEQDAGLRPAQQLVARERDSIDAAGERLGHGRLAREPPPREVEQQAAPQIEQTRDPGGARDRGDLLRRHVGGETRDLKVGAVHLEEQSRGGSDRTLVILAVGAVRRPDLDELRPGPRHDIGNAERSTDLHQLAARHDRVAVAGERREREQQRPRGVVHDERVRRSGELQEEAPAQCVARATAPCPSRTCPCGR